jgi:hypothetical protein
MWLNHVHNYSRWKGHKVAKSYSLHKGNLKDLFDTNAINSVSLILGLCVMLSDIYKVVYRSWTQYYIYLSSTKICKTTLYQKVMPIRFAKVLKNRNGPFKIFIN